eukprot:1176381-Prorocentrum_minimum.AAC.1
MIKDKNQRQESKTSPTIKDKPHDQIQESKTSPTIKDRKPHLRHEIKDKPHDQRQESKTRIKDKPHDHRQEAPLASLSQRKSGAISDEKRHPTHAQAAGTCSRVLNNRVAQTTSGVSTQRTHKPGCKTRPLY